MRIVEKFQNLDLLGDELKIGEWYWVNNNGHTVPFVLGRLVRIGERSQIYKTTTDITFAMYAAKTIPVTIDSIVESDNAIIGYGFKDEPIRIGDTIIFKTILYSGMGENSYMKRRVSWPKMEAPTTSCPAIASATILSSTSQKLNWACVNRIIDSKKVRVFYDESEVGSSETDGKRFLIYGCDKVKTRSKMIKEAVVLKQNHNYLVDLLV